MVTKFCHLALEGPVVIPHHVQFFFCIMRCDGCVHCTVVRWLLCSYSLATDHLQKTVFYYVDVVRLLYPAWSPDTGVFPFSSSDAGGGFSLTGTSYASNVDAGVRAMLGDDVSGDPGSRRQVLDVAEWIGNTSAFLRVVGKAATKAYHLVTSEPSNHEIPMQGRSIKSDSLATLYNFR